MEIIRSAQNPLYKQAHKLAENRRERLKQGCTLLIGLHLVESALEANWPLQRLLVRAGSELEPAIAGLIGRRVAPVTVLGADLFDALEQFASTTGIIALTELPPAPPLAQKGGVLLLDGVQDPGNVGTILRTAAAAGVDQVWLTPGCADAWSPKVIRAAMGAHFVVPVVERVQAGLAIDAFSGPLVTTALTEAESIYQTDLGGDLILALGSEGNGLSEELLARATRRIRIPMVHGVESLNVSAAAAVCLFERVRQHGRV